MRGISLFSRLDNFVALLRLLLLSSLEILVISLVCSPIPSRRCLDVSFSEQLMSCDGFHLTKISAGETGEEIGLGFRLLTCIWSNLSLPGKSVSPVASSIAMHPVLTPGNDG